MLTHLKHYYPDWQHEVIVNNPGKVSVFKGWCDSFTKVPDTKVDKVIEHTWKEPDCIDDLPATKVTKCLRECFNIEPLWDLLTYKVHVGKEAKSKVDNFWKWERVVAIHHQGNSVRPWKDVPEGELLPLVGWLYSLGYTVLLLDWDARSNLRHYRVWDGGKLVPVMVPVGRGHTLWAGQMLADAEILGALLQRCRLVVGVDSGPKHLSAAVGVPTVAVWTRLHPVHYQDNCPSLVHLLPTNHADYLRGNKDLGLKCLERYQYETYTDLAPALVRVVAKLLGESAPQPRPVSLINRLSPGDGVAMSACLEQVHQQYPGKYIFSVDCPWPDVYRHSPYVAKLANAEKLQTHYPAINECNQRPVHFMEAYCEYIGSQLNLNIKLRTNKPNMWLSEEELRTDILSKWVGKHTKTWLGNFGVKKDYTCKWYGGDNYARVVDALMGEVQFVQVGHKDHLHPVIPGCINLIGKTTLRDLIVLAYHASGYIGPVSFLMHVFAAFNKPTVILNGGREPVAWNVYPNQTFLHTLGALPCCTPNSCWRNRIKPLNDGDDKDKSLCELPIHTGKESVPKCMMLISPHVVVDCIRRYYVGGSIKQ